MKSRRALLRLSIIALIAAVIGPTETEQERNTRLIREALATPEGRRKLSEAMLRGAEERQLKAAKHEHIRGQASLWRNPK